MLTVSAVHEWFKSKVWSDNYCHEYQWSDSEITFVVKQEDLTVFSIICSQSSIQKQWCLNVNEAGLLLK